MPARTISSTWSTSSPRNAVPTSPRRRCSWAACTDMSAAPVLLDEATRVWRVTAGVFASNCYIVGLGDSRRCAVVDPGLGTAAITDAIDALGLEPAAVVCTHGHFDHV